MAWISRTSAAIVFVLATQAHADSGAPVTLTGETMGTTYTVRLTRLPDGVSAAELQREIDRRLERVNDLMSTWRPDSELSRFNRHQGTDWFPVSADTAKVVAEARRTSDLSGGAFDATVMPLVDLWSFGPAGRPQAVPSPEELAAARERVGYENVEVRSDPPALRKLQPGVQLDLSAIAKGYGVDVIAASLEGLGSGLQTSNGPGKASSPSRVTQPAHLKSVSPTPTGDLVEIGGEVRARGTKPDGAAWQVGIETPTSNRRGIQRVLALRDRAL
ncbi:MAG TPA: FAD:protein FMN transferase, partial [Planctomycetaceae bacterium]|nr:FAD:protein FMN transferase [Planctomycetaceae bacterium]